MIKFLSSIHLTIALLLLLIIACIIGTIVIQSPTLHFDSIDEIKKFYIMNNGNFFGQLIIKFNLHNVFYSNWFIGLMFFLVVHITVCTIKNWSVRLSKLGFIMTHLSIIIILCGCIIGNKFGDKGFFWISNGSTVNEYISIKTGKNFKLPFNVHLEHFELKYYSDDNRPGMIHIHTPEMHISYRINTQERSRLKIDNTKYSIQIKGYYPDFTFDMKTKTATSQSENPNNPALHIEIYDGAETETRYLFAAHPDFMHNIKFKDIRIIFEFKAMVSDYISRLKIESSAGKNFHYDLMVNHPLSIDGYKLYQSSYDKKTQTAAGIEVVKDPGLEIVYFGFALLTIGIFFIFYIKPYILKKNKKIENISNTELKNNEQ